MSRVVIHYAGPMIDGVQRCVRCNYVIDDQTNCYVAPNPDGSPGDMLDGFPEGEITIREGNPRVTSTGADADGVPCKASS